MEVLLRATAENGYPRVSWLMTLAEVDVSIIELQEKPQVIEKLVSLLRCNPESLQSLVNSSPFGESNLRDFFGVEINKRLISGRYRRVSPRALKISPHLRAVWAVRPLSFDPQTREKLLDRCPVCAKRFSFEKVQAIWSCDFCSYVDSEGFERPAVDLRDFPQEIVEVVDEDALDFVLSLIDPCWEGKLLSERVLQEDLQNLTKGELFAFVMKLNGDREAYERSDAEPFSMRQQSVDCIYPETLAAAGRIVLNWPTAYYEFIEKLPSNGCFRDAQSYFNFRYAQPRTSDRKNIFRIIRRAFLDHKASYVRPVRTTNRQELIDHL